MERGTPFALAHTFRQTGPFRPAQRRPPRARASCSSGSSTVPGVGVPMVLVSGKLAAAARDRDAMAAAAMTVTLEDELRRVPAAEQAPRHDVLLVDDAAADGQAPPRPRPVRVLPLRRRHRRRPRRRRRSPARAAALRRLRRPLLRRPRPRAVRRPRAEGGGAHGAGVRHRPRRLPPLPALDGDGPHRRVVRDVRRPARLHGRLGGGDRRDDAADPRAARSRRGAARRPAPSARRSS